MAGIVEFGRPPFEGEFNTNVLTLTNGRLSLRRLPKENRRILSSIAYEYDKIGFTKDGGSVRRRSPEEQMRLTQEAAEKGLLVIPPFAMEGNVIYYPFVTCAKTLDEYLPDTSQEELISVTSQLFTDLRKAHRQAGIVYGDRWSHNILITPLGRILNVDFDLEISGPTAVEFELAQAVYYTLSAAGERAIPLLAEIIGGEEEINLQAIETYLRGHALHFDLTKFGGIKAETERLIERIIKRREVINALRASA